MLDRIFPFVVKMETDTGDDDNQSDGSLKL